MHKTGLKIAGSVFAVILLVCLVGVWRRFVLGPDVAYWVYVCTALFWILVWAVYVFLALLVTRLSEWTYLKAKRSPAPSCFSTGSRFFAPIVELVWTGKTNRRTATAIILWAVLGLFLWFSLGPAFEEATLFPIVRSLGMEPW